MITFLLPSTGNPNGLSTTLLSIRENVFAESAEVIVILDKTDTFLQENLSICNSTCLLPMKVRAISFETPSYTARVNYSAMCTNTPFVCLINDDIILEKASSPIETLIKTRSDLYPDLIVVLYLCMKEAKDNGYSFPILSRRAIDLLGYLFHPVCCTQPVSERWIGSIFHDLGRIDTVTDVPLSLNEGHPSRIAFNEEAVQEAELLYRVTGKVRKMTCEMLKQFIR